jgi:hypothetical protein
MEMMVRGRSTSLFQSSQQWSTISSWDVKTRFDNQLSRMNCQTRARREEDDGDVVGHVELGRPVPAGLIHEQDAWARATPQPWQPAAGRAYLRPSLVTELRTPPELPLIRVKQTGSSLWRGDSDAGVGGAPKYLLLLRSDLPDEHIVGHQLLLKEANVSCA